MAVYLLHLDRPVSGGNACHYIGWAACEKNAHWLLERHRKGKAYAAFTREAAAQGIGMEMVNLWPDAGKDFERKLKREKNAWRHCATCRAVRGLAPLQTSETQVSHRTNKQETMHSPFLPLAS